MSSKRMGGNLMKSDARSRRRKRGGGKKKRGRMEVYGSALGQLRKDVSSIYRMLNVEDKHIDVTASVVSSAVTWTQVLFNACQQGTSATTRIGQSIKCSGIEVRFSCQQLAAQGFAEILRFVVFIDHQADATLATPLFVYPATTVAARTDGYVEQYTVLYDECVNLSPGGQDVYSGKFISRQNFHVAFNTGNAGTIADINTNAIYFMFVNPNVAAAFATVNYFLRFIFIDN